MTIWVATDASRAETGSSSPVVGSSAMSRAGSPANPNAINGSLPKAARELAWVVTGAPRRVWNTHRVEQVEHVLVDVPLPRDLVGQHRFDDLIADSEDRVERGVGVLRHQPDFPAANLLQRGVVQVRHVARPPLNRFPPRSAQAPPGATAVRAP